MGPYPGDPIKPNYLPKSPPPNTITPMIRASAHGFWVGTDVLPTQHVCHMSWGHIQIPMLASCFRIFLELGRELLEEQTVRGHRHVPVYLTGTPTHDRTKTKFTPKDPRPYPSSAARGVSVCHSL